MNAKMREITRSFEEAGFADVQTVLSSGNVVFRARPATNAALERKAEIAMEKRLGRPFLTIVRPIVALQKILASNPYLKFTLPSGAKRVVTLLRRQTSVGMPLPIEQDGARILCATAGEIFSVYVPGRRGLIFMTLIEKNFGKRSDYAHVGDVKESGGCVRWKRK
jgi:Protein of unknown function (DUF1697)